MTFHQTINLETAKNILADRYIVDTSEHDEQVRSDERGKLAEWIVRKNGYLNLFNNDANALLAEYEKEQKYERNTH